MLQIILTVIFDLVPHQPYQFSGEVVISREGSDVKSSLGFRVMDPFGSDLDLMINKRGEVFLVMMGVMTKEKLLAFTPQQQIMIPLLAGAIATAIHESIGFSGLENEAIAKLRGHLGLKQSLRTEAVIPEHHLKEFEDALR